MAKYRIGHSGITWGFDATTAEQTVRELAELGYSSYETMAHIIEQYEEEYKEGFDDLLRRYKMPFSAVYCKVLFPNPDSTPEIIDTVAGQAKHGGELGCTTLILQAGSGRSKTGPVTESSEWRAMGEVFGEIARRAREFGLVTTIHPHTGTLVETLDEIDSILGCVDPDLVFFAPDTGHIAKGGGDPVEIFKRYRSQIRHVHLKDYGGGGETGYMGFQPVGFGMVDVPAIFEVLDGVAYDRWISVELNGTPHSPRSPKAAAAMSKRYLSDLLGDRVEWRNG